MCHKIQMRNSKGLGALTRASSNPPAQQFPRGFNSQTTDFDSQSTKRVRGIYAYNTQNEEQVAKERATKSIFDEDSVKKPLNEAVRSNNDLSWAASSI